jgi:hypothetical protein
MSLIAAEMEGKTVAMGVEEFRASAWAGCRREGWPVVVRMIFLLTALS